MSDTTPHESENNTPDVYELDVDEESSIDGSDDDEKVVHTHSQQVNHDLPPTVPGVTLDTSPSLVSSEVPSLTASESTMLAKLWYMTTANHNIHSVFFGLPVVTSGRSRHLNLLREIPHSPDSTDDQCKTGILHFLNVRPTDVQDVHVVSIITADGTPVACLLLSLRTEGPTLADMVSVPVLGSAEHCKSAITKWMYENLPPTCFWVLSGNTEVARGLVSDTVECEWKYIELDDVISDLLHCPFIGLASHLKITHECIFNADFCCDVHHVELSQQDIDAYGWYVSAKLAHTPVTVMSEVKIDTSTCMCETAYWYCNSRPGDRDRKLVRKWLVSSTQPFLRCSDHSILSTRHERPVSLTNRNQFMVAAIGLDVYRGRDIIMFFLLWGSLHQAGYKLPFAAIRYLVSTEIPSARRAGLVLSSCLTRHACSLITTWKTNSRCL
jgi:hypothetical protein